MGVEISVDNDKHYIRVKGELTVETVMDALQQFSRECQSLSRWVIDFTQVSKVDSTAIALLIELKRKSLKQRIDISFIYLPPALLQIARLSQVEGLLTAKS